MLREQDHPVPPDLPDMDWMLFAACSELELKESDRLFFCGQGQSGLASRAKAICSVCEVHGECLEFALSYPEGNRVRGVGWDYARAPEAPRTISMIFKVVEIPHLTRAPSPTGR